MRIRVRIVVPGGDVDHRTRGQEGQNIVGVVVGDTPAVLIIAHATERVGSRRTGTRRIRSHVRIDGFHALRLAAHVKVRLKRRDNRGPGKTEVTVISRDLSGRQIQIAHVAHMLCESDILRRGPFRIQLESE